VDQAPPTATPTPDTPFLQTCLQEDINQQQAACTRTVDRFYVTGSADDAIAFVVPTLGNYNYSSIEWRIFKETASGGATPQGSYTDSSGDPQNPGVWWQLSSLLYHFSSISFGTDTGTYKVEVLDHDGKVIASTSFTIMASPFAQSSGNDTPTPDASTYSDTPTPTGY